MVNSSISIGSLCWWLRVGEARLFLFERRKCPGTGARRGAPGRQSCMIQKKILVG
jgi:hypothetical protein